MINKTIFAGRLKKLRSDKCLSQMDLAIAVGLKTKGSISNFEKEIAIPSLEVFNDLAEYFNVSLDYLSGRLNDDNEEKLWCQNIAHKRLELFLNPDGAFEYEYFKNNELNKSVLKYSFGLFPLEHLMSRFLFIEELHGNCINDIVEAQNNIDFAAFVGFLNKELLLGYKIDAESNGVHKVNLIIKKESKLNPIPNYFELRVSSDGYAKIEKFFFGYECFIDEYLRKKSKEKVDFLKDYLSYAYKDWAI